MRADGRGACILVALAIAGVASCNSKPEETTREAVDERSRDEIIQDLLEELGGMEDQEICGGVELRDDVDIETLRAEAEKRLEERREKFIGECAGRGMKEAECIEFGERTGFSKYAFDFPELCEALNQPH